MIEGGPSAFSIYMCIVLYGKLIWCSGIQGMYDQLTGGVHLPWVYVHCAVSARADKFVVAVFKASMLNCLGGPSAACIYVHSSICKTYLV